MCPSQSTTRSQEFSAKLAASQKRLAGSITRPSRTHRSLLRKAPSRYTLQLVNLITRLREQEVAGRECQGTRLGCGVDMVQDARAT